MAFILFAIISKILGFGSSPDKPSGPDQIDAQATCQVSIEDALKAPSTASFSDWSSVSTGSEGYEISGVVDAQNSFGAMLRSPFVCILKIENGEYRVIDYHIE